MGIFKDDDDKTLDNVSLPDDFNLDDVSDELSSLFKEADSKDAGDDGGFGDDSLDKDLLSQIFSDESGGDADLDQAFGADLPDGDGLGDDLDKLLNEIENIEDAAKASAEKEAEKKAASEDKKNTGKKADKKKETKPVEEEKKTEEEPIAEEPIQVELPLEEEKQEEKEEKKEEIKMQENPLQHDITDGALTLISEGTTIKGGITSEVSIEVMGTINGDIESKGKVAINGTVTGSVSAAEIYVNTPRLEGSLNSEGTVQISADTIVVGDIVGASAYIAGAVKGSIDVNGSVVLDESAVVKGDIKAKSIQINEGAVLDGHCILSYSDINIDKVFETDSAPAKADKSEKAEKSSK